MMIVITVKIVLAPEHSTRPNSSLKDPRSTLTTVAYKCLVWSGGPHAYAGAVGKRGVEDAGAQNARFRGST